MALGSAKNVSFSLKLFNSFDYCFLFLYYILYDYYLLITRIPNFKEYFFYRHISTVHSNLTKCRK